jgi:nicotinamide N-methyltransferase
VEWSIHPRAVLELGAGASLPPLLASTLPAETRPHLVVTTDYPDPGILGNLEGNVARNVPLAMHGAPVRCVGYEWGADVAELR